MVDNLADDVTIEGSLLDRAAHGTSGRRTVNPLTEPPAVGTRAASFGQLGGYAYFVRVSDEPEASTFRRQVSAPVPKFRECRRGKSDAAGATAVSDNSHGRRIALPSDEDGAASSASACGPVRGVPAGLALPEQGALARLLDRRRPRREAALLLPPVLRAGCDA
jgi:hypothetical protein